MNKPPEKIAVFMPHLLDGGAERSMLKLSRGIASRGYPVDLVLSSAAGPFTAEVPETVRLVDLKSPRVLMSLPLFIRYLRKERPAAVLSVMHANLVALWAKRLAGVPVRVVVSERNTLSVESRRLRADLRMRLMPVLVRWFYPWADGITAVSRGAADDLVRVTGLPGGRVRVIYNPIITPEMVKKTQEGVDHPWFKPGQPPVVLGAGRLSPQKDFTTLIQAFALVRKRHPARLIILGEGDERRRLEALVKELGLEDDVSLPGFAANPYPYMREAAVFVLSSQWEGLPGVLIEALYCGAQLVSTDCPSGPREILAGGKYGALVPPGDAGAMAGAIIEALNSERKSAPEECWLPFTLEGSVNLYLEALLGN